MKAKDLLPGNKVDIRIVAEMMRDDVIQPHSYFSNVFDSYDDNILDINMPISGGKLIILSKGIRYDFVFTTKDGLYRAQGQVISKLKKDNFYLLRIKLDKDLEKFQRREYYRLSCMIQLLYLQISEDSASQPTMLDVQSHLAMDGGAFKVRGMGTVLDISGGGLRFITSTDLDGIDYLLLQFAIDEEGRKKQMELIAHKLASKYLPEADKYEHRVQFLYKDKTTKDSIIKYIFEQERRIRKKEQG